MYFSLFSIFAIVSIGQVFGHIYENTFEQDIAISALHLSQAAYCMTHIVIGIALHAIVQIN